LTHVLVLISNIASAAMIDIEQSAFQCMRTLRITILIWTQNVDFVF